MKLYTIKLEVCVEDDNMTPMDCLDWDAVLHLEDQEYVCVLEFEDHGEVEDDDPDEDDDLDTDPYGVPYGGCK